jgi:ribonuclease HII
VSSPSPSLKRESSLWGEGFSVVAGIDEVGRGSWAGPVVAAAVVPPRGKRIYRVRDSKLLTPRARAALVPKIIQWAEAVGVGAASEYEVDRLGLSEAVRLAGLRALKCLNLPVDYVLLDGNWNYLKGRYPSEAIVGADRLCLSVAAASVVAKVTRDRLLGLYDQAYPGYGFAAHKGYASALHTACLEELGPSQIHRTRFLPIKRLTPPELFFTHIETGRIGETYAADYLKSEGYEIVEANYRTRYGEIDLVAKEGGELVLVEVKTRSGVGFGLPEEAVDKKKQARLVRMAYAYVMDKAWTGSYRIDVLAVEVERGRPTRIELFRHAVGGGEG